MSFQEWFEGMMKEGGFIEEREWAGAGWEAGYQQALIDIWKSQSATRSGWCGYYGDQDSPNPI